MPVTPLLVTPVIVTPPTYPAVFAIRTKPGGTFKTGAVAKLKRPGVIIPSSMLCRDGDLLTPIVEIQLKRPAVPPAGIRKLAVRSDPDGLQHFLLMIGPDQSDTDFADVKYRDDRESAGYLREGLLSSEHDQKFRELVENTAYEFYRAPVEETPLVLDCAALGLPGWPIGQRKVPPPPPTASYAQGLSQEIAGRDKVYPKRAELEIWLTLDNESSDGQLVESDVALVTQAPILLSSEIDPPERLFAVFQPDSEFVVGNFGTIASLCNLAYAAQVPVTLLDGEKTNEDLWAQDAVLLGYSSVPGKSYSAVVATNRHKQTRMSAYVGIEDQLVGYQSDDNTGLFTEILEALANKNTMDYGGNVVVSPPVGSGTAQLEEDTAGGAVAQHPAAPYGKILVGDDGSDAESRPSRLFRNWLHAQKAQPVLPLATGWLHVKHVDEVLGLCRAPRVCPYTGCGAKGHVFLFADPDLYFLLTSMAGKAGAVFGDRFPQRELQQYTLTQDPKNLLDADSHSWKRTLLKIKDRLSSGLDLEETDFLPMPVLYTPGGTDAQAISPNLVNGIFLGSTVILPKPYGPVVSLKNAGKILTQLPTQEISGDMVNAAQLASLLDQTYWAYQGMDDEVFPDYFGREAVESVKKLLNSGAPLPGPSGKWPTGVIKVPPKWSLWSLKMKGVCIFEAYVRVRMAALGLQAYFVDDWKWYHNNEGELHCGTKVRRTPPGIEEGNRWWEVWEPLLAVTPADP